MFHETNLPLANRSVKTSLNCLKRIANALENNHHTNAKILSQLHDPRRLSPRYNVIYLTSHAI